MVEVEGAWPALGLQEADKVDVNPNARLKKLIGLVLER